MKENGQIYILAALPLPTPLPHVRSSMLTKQNADGTYVQCAKFSEKKYL